MKKILTIARREYQAMVATKAFLIGLAMMPVLMLGGMYVPSLLKGIQKSEERTIAVIGRHRRAVRAAEGHHGSEERDDRAVPRIRRAG